MTEPLNAATDLGRRRRPVSTLGATPSGLRGRWPSTDQLTAPTVYHRSTSRGEAEQPVPAESLPAAPEPALPPTIDVDVDVDNRADQDLVQRRLVTFEQRMAAVNASFTNPSAGETSVDRPLVTIEAHVLHPDSDASMHRHRPAAPRLR